MRIIGFVNLPIVAAIALAAALGCPAAASTAPAKAAHEIQTMANAFELRPGVIVEPGRGEAYLMSPHGELDAIGLSSGKSIWSTTAAAKPLALAENRLVAQGETSNGRSLPVVVLDTRRAGKVAFKTSLLVPAGVTASIDQGFSGSFVAAALLQRSTITVWWTFSERVMTGVVPRVPPPERRQDGAARIDLKTGRVETLATEQAKALSSPPPGKPPRVSASEALLSPPERVGRLYIAIESKGRDPGPRMILKRWTAESGEPLPDIELAPGSIATNASADGLLLAAARAVGPDAMGRQNYEWSIYSLLSGNREAELRMPTSAAPFFVWDSTLVYESRPFGHRVDGNWLQEPLELRALDLTTGIERWKKALRDTAYRGPWPPTP